jgi:hypothetical protein
MAIVATDKTKVSSYMSGELVAKGKTLAALNGKSLSGYLEVLLQEAIAKAEAKGAKLTLGEG